MNKQKLKNFICNIIDEYSSSNANSHWSLDRDIMTLLAKYKSDDLPIKVTSTVSGKPSITYASSLYSAKIG